MKVINERYYDAVVGGCGSCDEHRAALAPKSEGDKGCGCNKFLSELPVSEMRGGCLCGCLPVRFGNT